MHPTISIRHLTKSFGTGPALRTAVSDASLDVAGGEWVALTGPSGCGKSTLLHMAGGLLSPDSGSCRIEGTEISSMSDRERTRFRRRRIGIVFQRYNLIDDLTVRQNVELPVLLHGARPKQAKNEANEMLERLGLAPRSGDWPGQLSGGEQQRVAIARALIARPSVILADEPTGALDSTAASAVVDLLRAAGDQGQTILMVTHDHHLAWLADRIVRMHDGSVLAGSPPAPTVPALEWGFPR